MDVAALLQSVANQITTQSAPTVPHMVSTSTQTPTWNELTLQMISDIISHQVIHMKNLETPEPSLETPLPSYPSVLQTSCLHVAGMTWKDIAQIMVNSHKNICSNTGVELAENIVRITVDQPLSGLDYIKTSVEVHIPGLPESKTVKETSYDSEQAMKSDQDGVCENKTETNEFSKSLHPLFDPKVVEDTNSSLLKISGDLLPAALPISQDAMSSSTGDKVPFESDKLCSKKGDKDNALSEQTLVEQNKLQIEPVPLSSDMEALISNQTSHATEISNTPNAPTQLADCEASQISVDAPEITSHKFGNPDNFEHHSVVMTLSGADNNLEVMRKPEQSAESLDHEIKNAFKEVSKQGVMSKIFKEDKSAVQQGEMTLVGKEEVESQNLTESKSIIHKCKICRKICRTPQQLERHTENHKQTNTEKSIGFECNICKKVFQSRWKLNKHSPTHDPDNDVHPCSYCDKVCKTVQSLLRHQRIHVEAASHCCTECGMTFRVLAKLKQHMTKEHNVTERHICNICGSIYKNDYTLKDHLFEHSGKHELVCNLCGKKFRRPELLRCHMFRHNAKHKPKSFKCSMCPKAYTDDRQLKVHIRLTHMKERDNLCSFCDKTFFYHYQLVAHENAHKGIMEHKCKYCEKEFVKRASLVTHEMVHTGNKPFKCRHCSKGFATKAHKARHERTHTGEAKPEQNFQCNICPSKFRYKGQLKDHEKRHAGVKDQACPYCKKGFVSRSDLVRHLRSHMAGKPHKCQYCQQTFSKRNELSVHELTHGSSVKIEST